MTTDNACNDLSDTETWCASSDTDDDERDERVDLPGLNSKNRVRKVDLKTRRSHGARFMGRVSKKLADPEVVAKLQKLNPNGATFIDIKPWPASLAIDFQEPLSTLRFPWDFYDTRTKCVGLVSQEKYLKYKDDSTQEGFLAFPKVCLNGILSSWSNKTPKDLKSDPAPHITAFHFKWRSKVVIDQNKSTSRRYFGLLPTTVPIKFDSKFRFTRTVDQLRGKIVQLHNDLVHVLDNDVSSNSTVLGSIITSPMETAGSSENLNIYSDGTQHKILLVPVVTKRGFEMEYAQSSHSFPMSTRFKLGNRVFERDFDLILSFTKTPQQYCLAFYFPDSNGVITMIKTLLTVNCIFPISVQEAQLTACFPVPEVENPGPSENPEATADDGAIFNPDALASDFVTHVCDDLEKTDTAHLNKSLQVCYEAGWRHHEKNTYQYQFRSGNSANDRRYHQVEKHKKKQDMLGVMKSDHKNWNSS